MPIRATILLAVVVAALVVAADARAASFDYLYIEANEGGSSGGHVAVRFGERTYHFQNRDGLLVLDRDTTRDFLHSYALLSNRTIELRRIEVDDAAASRAAAQFDRRHRIQARQLDVLAALREDHDLLAAWGRGEPGPGVPALGYFDLAGRRSERVARLLARIRDAHGSDFVVRRRAALALAADAAVHDDPTPGALDLPRDVYDEPAFKQAFARRYAGVEASRAALFVLEQATGLAAEATIRPGGPRWWIDRQERAQLAAYRGRLEDELVRLANSARSDWGRPFLVGLARLLALDETLATGRLAFLNAYPDDARALDEGIVARRRGLVTRMVEEAHERVESARAGFAAADAPGEREWVRVEDAANRVHELSVAASGGRLRVVRGALVPSRRAARPNATAPSPSDGRDATQAAASRIDAYQAALDRLYRYQVVSRNCVSEIFHTLDDAFGREGSQRALGGHVDGDGGLTFIPFVSADAVSSEYRVRSRQELPSWREQRLEAMRAQENPVWVALRESNTLTARSYRKGVQDSWFLFFTDDAFVLRPVFGVFNVLAGIGESLYGLTQLPFDRGDALVSGLQGSFASLPELVFVNIRKGSNDWVPQSDLPVPQRGESTKIGDDHARSRTAARQSSSQGVR